MWRVDHPQLVGTELFDTVEMNTTPAGRDVDLGISPCTNTLTIRRLGLEIGELGHLDAVWVRFPEMNVEVLTQTYERLGDRMFRYTSPGFQRGIEVDDAGSCPLRRRPLAGHRALM
jgi:hypothetical protein